ncbi:MAG TPA: alpha/beta hydrolase [Acidimicrobiia bacterium]
MSFLTKLLVAALAVRALLPVLTPKFKQPQVHPWRQAGRTVFVGDSEFLVREAGPETGDPLLVIHGLGGSSLAEWYEVAPLLAAHRRVILLDHRGHGLSVLSRGPYEISDEADDIAGVLDQLGVDTCDVVGYSLGGAVAQELAHHYPGRVKKMVLVATFTYHPQPLRTLRAVGSVLVRGFERIFGFGTPDVRAGYLLATGAVAAEHARWFWEETHRRDVDAGAQASLAMLRFDSREWLGRLDTDTLVVIPTEDQLVPVSWQYELASSLRNVTVVEVAGARHEVPWTHPVRLAGEIGDFLAR